MPLASVPFEYEALRSVRGSLDVMKAHGILRVEQEHLVLEFTVRTQLELGGSGGLGITVVTEGGTAFSTAGSRGAHEPEEVRTVRIPFDQVAVLRRTGGLLFRPKLHIEVNRVGALAAVPWAEGIRCVLPLRRADRLRAREFLVDAELRIAEAQLRSLEGST